VADLMDPWYGFSITALDFRSHESVVMLWDADLVGGQCVQDMTTMVTRLTFRIDEHDIWDAGW
jgi:hypothetical protein